MRRRTDRGVPLRLLLPVAAGVCTPAGRASGPFLVDRVSHDFFDRAPCDLGLADADVAPAEHLVAAVAAAANSGAASVKVRVAS